MRRIAAQYLFKGQGAMLRNGVVTLDNDGKIAAVGQLSDTEICSTEFYNGILTPGFVNAHCHLELSHLCGAIAPQQGMAYFINAMNDWSRRLAPDVSTMCAAMKKADDIMQAEGIVAVGDICNTNHSFNLKRDSRIYYHSFVEAVGLAGALAQEKIVGVAQVLKEAVQARLPASITPHAFYSMSPALFAYAVNTAKASGILSIHNQEGDCEGSVGLRHLLSMIAADTRLLLVHNTYTTTADIAAVNRSIAQAVWVLCPNSNLYITDALPPADMLYKNDMKVAFGTDSLASNTQLSILEEIKTISRHFPQIPLEVLLEWATFGGAAALNKSADFGLIALGRKPGLVLIEGINFATMQLLPTARARRVG